MWSVLLATTCILYTNLCLGIQHKDAHRKGSLRSVEPNVTVSRAYEDDQYDFISECLRWTKWYNSDNALGKGDWEIVSTANEMGFAGIIQDRYKHDRICTLPVSIQCETLAGVQWSETPDNLYVPCEKNIGLVCRTKDQNETKGCSDYKVRFLCWNECRYFAWSPWFDQDDPDGEGDFEILGETIAWHLLPSRGIKAVDVQCATTADIPIYKTVRRGLRCDLLGFSCHNDRQGENCKCEDYKVRFLCPVYGKIPGGYVVPSH